MRTFYTIFERNDNGVSRVCIARNKNYQEVEPALEEAKELTDHKIVNRVPLVRHRPGEPFGKGADTDG